MPQRPAVPRASTHAAVAALAVALVCLLAYASSFRCAFVFDDIPSIRDNPVLRDLGNYLPGRAGYAQFPNRWMAFVSFALNRAAGGLDVVGFHVTNLVIHATTAFLVYLLVVLTFRTTRLSRSAVAGSSKDIALTAALLFASHPIQSQAVTYVVQRIASLATLFYVLTVVLYARWRLAGSEVERPRWVRMAGYLPAFVTAVLAMKTKEIAFTLPAAVALYELMFLEGRSGRRLAYLLPICATALLVPLTLLGLDRPVGEILASAQDVTKVQTAMSRWDYLVTQLVVIVLYLRLLVLPVGLNVDHDVPLHHSLFEPAVLGSFTLLCAIVLAGAVLLRRTSRRAARPLDPAARLVSFGIGWFFLGLSVESSVIPIVDLVFEHRVYLPSVGFFTAVAAGGALLVRRAAPSRVRLVLPVAAALSVVLALATLQRNRVWESPMTLWSDALAKSPNLTRPHTNVALALAAAGRETEALAHFQAVVRINPLHVSGYNNLAVSLEKLGRTEEAAGALELALRLKPDHAETYFNLGSLRMDQRRNAEAAELLYKAIALDPAYVSAYANLSGALNELGRPAETVRLVEGKDALLRDSTEARFNLGVAYVLLGDGPGAARALSVLARLAPDRAEQLATYMRVRKLR